MPHRRILTKLLWAQYWAEEKREIQHAEKWLNFALRADVHRTIILVCPAAALIGK